MSQPNPVRVLVVEDDFLVSEMVHSLLERAGYVVVGKASDGQQAVQLTLSLRPDVLVIDIELPGGLDGLQVAERIQVTCPTPVVVLTAYETPELIRRAGDVGVGAYLTKPPSAQELDRAIVISLARFNDLLKLRQLNADLQAEIAERQRAEAARTRWTQELMTLYETALEINAQPDLPALLNLVCDRARSLLGVPWCELYLTQPDSPSLRLTLRHSPSGQDSTPPGLAGDLASWVAETRQAIVLDDYQTWEGRADALAVSALRRIMSLPLKVGTMVLGVINLADDKRIDPYTDHEFWLANLFTDLAAVALQNTLLRAPAQPRP